MWGFPFGYNGTKPIVTAGIISGSDVEPTKGSPPGMGMERVVINAAINLGNSGAAYLRYSTDHGAILGNAQGDNFDVNAVDSLRLYANTAADGSGDYEPAMELRTSGEVTLTAATGSTIDFKVSGTIVMQADETVAAGNTSLIVRDVDSGLSQRVKVGANGSGPGGVGRALYIDNV